MKILERTYQDDELEQATEPFLMYAEYEDGAELYFNGESEDDCICAIAQTEDLHGKCVFYTGVTSDYFIDGELRGEPLVAFDWVPDDRSR